MALSSLGARVILGERRNSFRIKKRMVLKNTGCLSLSSIELQLASYLFDQDEGKPEQLVAEGVGWIQLLHAPNAYFDPKITETYDKIVDFEVYVSEDGLALPNLKYVDGNQRGYITFDRTNLIPELNSLERTVLRRELSCAAKKVLSLSENRQNVGSLIADNLRSSLVYLKGKELEAANLLISGASKEIEGANVISLAEYK
jgi:hypothetical protein